MLCKAIEFIGPCNLCDRRSETARAAVEVSLENGADVGELVCLGCANKLVIKLALAVQNARTHKLAGRVYRHDKWAEPKKASK